jgi:putative transcriptional regulator
MTISHHPAEDRIADYAAGRLDEGQHLAIAAHLDHCVHCRRLVAALEHAAGAMLTDLTPEALSPRARDRTLAALDSPETAVPTHPLNDMTELPATLRRHELGAWRWVGPGVHCRAIRFDSESRSRLFLLRAMPGTKLPQHTHSGTELTLVLKGSFSHEGGRFAAGDFEDADGEIEHRPVVGPEGECICLVAMEGELRLSGLLGRVMQPFVRL